MLMVFSVGLVSPFANGPVRFRGIKFRQCPKILYPTKGRMQWDLAECEWDLADLWMRSSRMVRASAIQCRSRSCPGFDPSILRNSWIWRVIKKQFTIFFSVMQSVYETSTVSSLQLLYVQFLYICKIKSSLIGNPCKNSGASHPHQRIWHPVPS